MPLTGSLLFREGAGTVMKLKIQPEIIQKGYVACLLLALCTLLFDIMASSISIIGLSFFWLLSGGIKQKVKIALREKFFLLSAAIFLSFIAGYFLSDAKSIAAFFIEKKLAFLVLPLLLLSYFPLHRAQVQLIFKVFILCTCSILLLATAGTIIPYLRDGHTDRFFYHDLLAPVNRSAIVVSYCCLLSIVFLFYIRLSQKQRYLIAFILAGYMILLSSRIFLAILLLLSLAHLFTLKSVRIKLIVAAALGICLLTLLITGNPVKTRFRDLSSFSLTKINNDQFSKEDYFDGLSLRLLYIRFSLEILQEQWAYLTGVGTGDAEGLLKEKIIRSGMYTGEGKDKDDIGYLRFSFHNQYLQTLVQTGIPGLSMLLALMTYCWIFALKHRNRLLLILMTIYSICFWTDDWLEFQVGLVSFLLLILISLNITKKEIRL